MKYCTQIEITPDIRLDLFTSECFRLRRSSLDGEKFPQEYEIPFALGRTDPWESVECSVDAKTDLSMVKVATDKMVIYVRKDGTGFAVEGLDGKRLYPEDTDEYGMFRNHCILFDSANFWNEVTDCSRYAHWFYNYETGLYDICLKEDKLLDVFFIYADTYRDGYRLFNDMVGAEPMLKKKGYGFYQTQHLGPQGTQALLMRTAEIIRERDIPCDTLILDFEWGDGANGGEELSWGSRLDWSREYSEPLSPEEMIKKLNDMHFDVMTIHHSIPAYEGRMDEGWTLHEYESDLWWSKMQEQLDIGVVGTWQDTRANDVTNSRIYNCLQERTGKRVSLMSNYDVYRNSSWTKECIMTPQKQRIGGRRYPFAWTGDTAMNSWSDFSYQVKSIVNVHGALKGVSYLTNDGMRPGGRELAVRSEQFLAFNSVSRSHNFKPWEGPADARALAERMAITKEKIEAAEYRSGDELLGLVGEDRVQEELISKYLKIRYSLLPYIYGVARECYDTGLPMTRPLMVQFENDENCNRNQYPYQFTLGNDILVAPVISDNKQMSVYLPAECQWVDFFTGEIYDGGREIICDTSDISVFPLFVRNGAVIPMQKECSRIDTENKDIILNIFGNAGGECVVYEDDGETLDYRCGKYNQIRVATEPSGDELQIKIIPERTNYGSDFERRVTVKHSKCAEEFEVDFARETVLTLKQETENA